MNLFSLGISWICNIIPGGENFCPTFLHWLMVEWWRASLRFSIFFANRGSVFQTWVNVWANPHVEAWGSDGVYACFLSVRMFVHYAKSPVEAITILFSLVSGCFWGSLVAGRWHVVAIRVKILKKVRNSNPTHTYSTCTNTTHAHYRSLQRHSCS